MAHHAILRASERLGIELTRDTLTQMAEAVRDRRARYLGSMVDGFCRPYSDPY